MSNMRKCLSVTLLLLLLISLSAACGSGNSGAGGIPASVPVVTELAANPKVSYLGPEGTYTEEAAQFVFQDGGNLQPKASVPEAIEDVLSGAADYAVIPQENTLGGAVVNYIDALLAQKELYVIAEVILPINQTLMALPGATLEEIQTVYSHAQGIAQTVQWRQEHLPNAAVQETSSTAAAASFVAESGDRTVAAIAAPGAAELYGLSVLAEKVQITDTNKTRFYVLSSTWLKENGQTNAVLAATCEASRIDDIIVAVNKTGVELVTIHDRPEGSHLGSYNYIIEVTNPSGLTDALIGKLASISDVRCLGAFQVLEKADEK